MQWSASLLTLLQRAMLPFVSLFERNGQSSNKLNKEISFLSRQGQLGHISKDVSSLPWTNIKKSTKISEKMEKSRDGCDTKWCIKSISDYRHTGKVCVCIYVCVWLSSWDRGWGDGIKSSLCV